MYRKMTMTAIAVLALGGMLWADETLSPAEKQALIQARVNTRSREIQKILADYNGQVSYQEVQNSVLTANADLQKRIATESAKAADTKDQAVIDQLSAKYTKVNKLWTDYQTDWAVYNKSTAEPVAVYQSMASINQYISQVEGWWLGNGMNLEPETLTACVSAELKRLDEVKTVLTKAIADFKAVCDQRQSQIKEYSAP